MIEELFSLRNKTIIVTGAGSGLGREFVQGLAQAKANVVLLDVQKDNIDKIAQEADPEKKMLLPVFCDVTCSQDIEKAIEQIDQKFGRIDVLINCAAILGSDKTMLEVEEKEWDKVLNVNLKGTWLMSKHVALYMISRQIRGKIIHISSILGKRSQLKRIHYASSKAAVEHLTRNMAMELIEYGILVNCMAPGWTETEMVKTFLEGEQGEKWRETIPMHRAANPKELLGVLIMLASEASSYMTGTIIPIDGGYSYLGIEPKNIN